MVKGIPSEGEYFVREDAEHKRRIALEMKKVMAEEQARALRELHYMHCPKCGMPLQEVDYGKVHVDACFNCGGIFLDKDDIGVIAAPQQKGIMGAILNWFKDETQRPPR
ncbi:MAG TPA: zf-TFIIB domain-containing protein [Anaeromyxobacteraceae bacterium]|nr:zf-TFIIB domain-containing protein [Anaeromyxobacteraceae bacterium]